MRYAMHTASGVSTARAARIDQQTGTSLFRNAINFPFDSPAFLSAWGVADLGDEYRTPVKSSVPTLFFSGDMDGRTSIDDATDVSRHFSQGRQVIVRGVAHDFYNLSPKVLAAMNDFLDGKPVSQSIDVPVQFGGPDELRLIREIRNLVTEKGVDAAVARLREVSGVGFPSHVSSYLSGTVGVGLWQQDDKKIEAVEILKAGVARYPNEVFLHERLADLYALLGQKHLALEHYRICLRLNPLNRAAEVKLGRSNAKG